MSQKDRFRASPVTRTDKRGGVLVNFFHNPQGLR